MIDSQETSLSTLCISVALVLPTDVAVTLQDMLVECARVGRSQLAAALQAFGSELEGHGRQVRLVTCRQEIKL